MKWIWTNLFFKIVERCAVWGWRLQGAGQEVDRKGEILFNYMEYNNKGIFGRGALKAGAHGCENMPYSK
jgi:hypothetical protein